MDLQLTKQELEKLKANLPRSYASIIAKRVDKSESLVRMVMSGNRYNQEIIDAAILTAQEHKQRMLDVKRIVNDL